MKLTSVVISLLACTVCSMPAAAWAQQILQFADWMAVDTGQPGTFSAGVNGAAFTNQQQEQLSYACIRSRGGCSMAVAVPVKCGDAPSVAIFARTIPGDSGVTSIAECIGENPAAPGVWVYRLNNTLSLRALARRENSLELSLQYNKSLYRTRFSMLGATAAMNAVEKAALGHTID